MNDSIPVKICKTVQCFLDTISYHVQRHWHLALQPRAQSTTSNILGQYLQLQLEAFIYIETNSQLPDEPTVIAKADPME